MFKYRNIIKSFIMCLLIIGMVYCWGQAAIINGKAYLAQILIKRAWEQQLLEPQRPYSPWSWADTHPVAKMMWESRTQQHESYILSGASGTSLAFGPGHMDGTAKPGHGHSIIGGHRDTHFTFLQHTEIGDEIHIQTLDGEYRTYRIIQARIVDSEEEPLTIYNTINRLTLVTCYPFDTIAPGGPMRFVVDADLEYSKPITVRTATRTFEHITPSKGQTQPVYF